MIRSFFSESWCCLLRVDLSVQVFGFHLLLDQRVSLLTIVVVWTTDGEQLLILGDHLAEDLGLFACSCMQVDVVRDLRAVI